MTIVSRIAICPYLALNECRAYVLHGDKTYARDEAAIVKFSRLPFSFKKKLLYDLTSHLCRRLTPANVEIFATITYMNRATQSRFTSFIESHNLKQPVSVLGDCTSNIHPDLAYRRCIEFTNISFNHN